jgi:hypothetical protein
MARVSTVTENQSGFDNRSQGLVARAVFVVPAAPGEKGYADLRDRPTQKKGSEVVSITGKSSQTHFLRPLIFHVASGRQCADSAASLQLLSHGLNAIVCAVQFLRMGRRNRSIQTTRRHDDNRLFANSRVMSSKAVRASSSGISAQEIRSKG